eukprot:773196-Pelagomonas_calceolata.AAC.2
MKSLNITCSREHSTLSSSALWNEKRSCAAAMCADQAQGFGHCVLVKIAASLCAHQAQGPGRRVLYEVCCASMCTDQAQEPGHRVLHPARLPGQDHAALPLAGLRGHMVHRFPAVRGQCHPGTPGAWCVLGMGAHKDV